MSVVFGATDEVLTKSLESRWDRGGRSIWPEAAVFGDDRREVIILEDNLVGVEFACEANGFAVERQIDSKLVSEVGCSSFSRRTSMGTFSMSARVATSRMPAGVSG